MSDERMLRVTEMRLVEIQAAINFFNIKSGAEKIKTPHWDDLEPAPPKEIVGERVVLVLRNCDVVTYAKDCLIKLPTEE